MRALTAQARAETLMTLRRGESLLLAVVIPVGALAGFSSVHIVNTGPGPAVDFLTPGILALAVMSTSLVNLAIATGFDRYYGVLKRLGTTPLGRGRLLAAKTASVLAVEVIQIAVLVVVGLLLGWHPGARAAGIHAAATLSVAAVAESMGAVLLATAAFSAMGLTIAGTLPAFAVLGLANGLWFALLLVGGLVAPLGSLPAGLRTVSEGLPSTALGQILHHALRGGVGVGAGPWLVLVAWGAGAGLVASVSFRWE